MNDNNLPYHHAVLVSRDEEMRRKRTGLPYSQAIIDTMDAWMGQMYLIQRQGKESFVPVELVLDHQESGKHTQEC